MSEESPPPVSAAVHVSIEQEQLERYVRGHALDLVVKEAVREARWWIRGSALVVSIAASVGGGLLTWWGIHEVPQHVRHEATHQVNLELEKQRGEFEEQVEGLSSRLDALEKKRAQTVVTLESTDRQLSDQTQKLHGLVDRAAAAKASLELVEERIDFAKRRLHDEGKLNQQQLRAETDRAVSRVKEASPQLADLLLRLETLEQESLTWETHDNLTMTELESDGRFRNQTRDRIADLRTLLMQHLRGPHQAPVGSTAFQNTSEQTGVATNGSGGSR